MMNGHLPDGAVLLTLEQLEQATTKYVRCPVLSQRTGQEVYVRIRTIRRADYLAMVPQLLPEATGWPEGLAERVQLMTDWVASLPEAQRLERQRALADVTYKLLAAGLVEPRATAQEARAFADDADVIALEILTVSGLAAPAAPAEPSPAIQAPAA